MSRKVAELRKVLTSEGRAAWVSQMWDKFHFPRKGKLEEWKELRNYLFATDTSTTSNNKLPWKNSTTLPKLTQIMDNLHSNYISALFPNDDWLRWEGYSKQDSSKQKAKAIQAYMSNKLRESNFRTTVSQLIYDYIDYGNAFCMPAYEERYKEGMNGDKVVDYVGPKIIRISPLDIVFDPTAASFEDTPKIVRSVKALGEIQDLANTHGEDSAWAKAILRRENIRKNYATYSHEDFEKAVSFSSDGFGSLYEYFMGSEMEILTFYGDVYDPETGEYMPDHMMVVVDRSFLAFCEPIPGWLGGTPIYHAGWRLRPDNLWAMGPLDNLVGMQYRIDHLENLKADAQDLIVHPPLKIKGQVEEFEWGPGAEIFMDEQGDVVPLSANLASIVSAQNEIQLYEARMEMYAGAPREAMGIRTPGEKTAFEVQQLQNAAGRIFQEKVTNFEINLLEKVLNAMLEIAKRNLTGSEVVKIIEDDLAVKSFMTVTKEDISASGVLRPIGARHFAAQAQLMQNLTGVLNSPVGQKITPHISSKKLAKLVEDVLGLDRYELFQPNVAIHEQAELQQEAQLASEEAQLEMQADLEEGV